MRTSRVWNKLFVLLFSMGIGGVYANPQLDTVVSGNVSVSQTANSTTVNQSSQKAIINWNSFNISAGEATRFVQPNASSVALNRIDPAQGASQIYGSLSANGQIILINAAGIHFGPSAMVNVGGLIASTSDISNENFLAGIYKFDQPSPFAASIVNEGTIIAANHGLIALIGHTVQNDGLIQAELGSIVLASGNKFTLDFYGDQLINFSVEDGSVGGKVTNNGTLLANGGRILVSAKTAQTTLDNVINMNGVAQARSVDEHNGEIILTANGSIHVTGTLDAAGMSDQAVGGKIKILGDYIHLASTAKLNASGNAGGGEILIGGNYQGKGPEQNALGTTVDAGAVINADAITSGDGGKVIVWSDGDTLFHGSASARGGSQSGNGGLVETSGHYLNTSGALVNTSAANGKSGMWLLDPNDVIISSDPTSIDEVYNSGTGEYTPTLTNPSKINVTELVNNLQTSNVTVLTTGSGVGNGDILVNDAITWNSNNTLTLTATRYIYLNADITATNGELALSAVNEAQDYPHLGAGSIGSGTLGSTPGSVTANINVKDFTLLQGQWHQFYNGTDPLPNFSVSNDFTIASDSDYNGIFNAQFTRVGSPMGTLAISDIYGLQGIATGKLDQGYILGNNIDATVTSNWNNGAGFVPIGTYGGVNRFYAASFEGQNRTINNLFINRTLTTQSSTANLGVGLFGYSMGSISNVGLTNANITLTLNYGDTPGYYGLGALVGFNKGFIHNSYSTGSVVGDTTASSLLSLKVGGLIGYNQTNSTTPYITNSYSTANVTLNTPAAAATSNIQVGGFTGANEAGTITNSFSTGKVSVTGLATGAFALVGGFVGGVFGNDTFGIQGKIENSYSTGSVTAESIYSVGGFAGLLSGSGLGGVATPSSVTNVYSLGNVSATTLATNIGGLIGLRSASSGITNSFWNTQTSGLSTSNGSTGAAGYRGMTTAQMQTQTNFTNTANGFVTTSNAWDFTSVWGMNSGSFPYLKAQYSSAPRVISGYIPGGSATATGLTGTNNVQLYVNGTALSNNGITTQGLLSSYANGFYYGLQSNGAVANGSAILANYVSGTANAITVAPNAGGNITGLNLTSNTVALGDDNLTSISATTMNTARNASVAIYTISGNNITLNSGIGLSSTANTTFTLNGNTTLTGSGSVNLGSVNLNTFSLTINNANASALGNITGTGALIKSGTGTLQLTGTNTYSGATTISAGTVQATGTNTLSPNSSITLVNVASAILNLGGFNNKVKSIAGGGNVGGNISLGSGTLTIENAASSGSTYSGVISGSGGLTINLAGVNPIQTLFNIHTFTGTTSIVAGTLQLGTSSGLGALNAGSQIVNNGNLNLSSSGSSTINNDISGTGDLYQSNGFKTLGGNLTYTGTTFINSGTLNFANNATLNNINVSSGANLRISNAALTGNITLNTSSNLVGVGTASVGGTISLAGSSSISTTAGTDVFTINAPINGAQSLGFQGAGTINVATTIGGTTPISGLTTASASTILLNGNITSSGTQSYSGALTLGSNRTLTSNGGITLTNGASGSFNLTLAGGSANDIFNIGGNLGINALTVTGGAGTNDLNFGNYSSAISANLTADHVGTISHNGTQIATFSGIHNLTGNDLGLISVSGALNNSSLYITSLGQGYIQGSSAFPTNFTRFTNPVPSPNVASASNNSNTSSTYVGSTNSSSTSSSSPTTNDTSSFRFAALQLVVNTLSASNPNTTNNFGNNNAVVSANNTPGYNTNYNSNPFNPIFMSGSGSGWSSSGGASSGNTSGSNSSYGNNANSSASAANSTTPLFNPAAANLTFNFSSMMDQIASTDISIAESQSISTSCN